MCVLVFIQNYSIFCGGIYYFYMQNFVIMQKKKRNLFSTWVKLLTNSDNIHAR